MKAKYLIFEYIEASCNNIRIRRHAKNGNQVPSDFADQLYAGRQQSMS
jgi:hypothetical protein